MTPSELKTWRQAQGLSQRELGDMLGVSNDTVSRWEKVRGRGRIPKLAEYAVKWLIYSAKPPGVVSTYDILDVMPAAPIFMNLASKIERTCNHRD